MDKLFHCTKGGCRYVQKVPNHFRACLRFNGYYVDYMASEPTRELRNSNCFKGVNRHLNDCIGKLFNIVALFADGGWKYLSTGLWTKRYDELRGAVEGKIWW